MTAPWGEESTAGAHRDPRPTPLGQAWVKNPVPRPLPRPRIMHLDTDANKPTRISELQQRSPLTALCGSLPGRIGGCRSPAGDGCGLGDSPTHGHGCPQGRRAQGGSSSLWSYRRGEMKAERAAGSARGQGKRGAGVVGQLGDQSGAPISGLLSEPSRGGRQAPIPRWWVGGRPQHQVPGAVGTRSSPGISGERGLQASKPGEPKGSLVLPAAAPSALRKVLDADGVLALGPRSLWDRWDTAAATCRFPLPRAAAAGEELRCCDLFPPARGRAPGSRQSLFGKSAARTLPPCSPWLPGPGMETREAFRGTFVPGCSAAQIAYSGGFPSAAEQATHRDRFFPLL